MALCRGKHLQVSIELLITKTKVSTSSPASSVGQPVPLQITCSVFRAMCVHMCNADVPTSILAAAVPGLC